MKGVFCLLAVILTVAVAMRNQPTSAAGAQAANRGTIKGHVRLNGKLPGNPVIRMGMDPMCSKINAGKRVIQETVLAALDGSLANVFVKLEGSFPQTPAPTEPVKLDQQGCVYLPRVVGARVGQTLQVHNSDELMHNVHSLSAKSNTFNVSEPKAGMMQQFKMKDEEMLQIKCDVHSWMTAYVGIVSHPYFAVSNTAGTFEIANVPAGTHKIQAWHERYGPVTQTVQVKAGATTTVDFMYSGTEPPPK
jgi:plastocyanin